jgi:hypothetical protein
VLFAAGCAALGLRFASQRTRGLRTGESEWTLTYHATFHARKAGAEIHAAFPRDTHYNRVEGNPAVVSDMERVPNRLNLALARHEVVLRSSKTGVSECQLTFTILVSQRGSLAADNSEAALSAHDHSLYLGKEAGIPVSDSSVQTTLERLRDGQPGQEELINRIFNFCSKEIAPGGALATEDGGDALRTSRSAPLGQVRAFAALCRASKLPTRIVTGFKIDSGSDVHPHYWAEVYVADHWAPFDLEDGFKWQLSEKFLPVRKNGADLIRLTNGSDLAAKYSIARIPSPAPNADYNTRWTEVLDLKALPANLQDPISIILLLPLGGLFTAFVRTIVGIRTFGTFTPTLLALAFVFTDRKSGLVVFFSVMVVGLLSRSMLDRLKLLLVPRLAIILTIVVMVMVLCISIMDHLSAMENIRWAPGSRTVLLPMVILTNLVERFYVATEEDSMRNSLRLLLTTMAMAFAIYLLLNFEYLKEKVLMYPELHFFTVVTLVLMGRYTGYRWTELVRFRDLAGRSEA